MLTKTRLALISVLVIVLLVSLTGCDGQTLGEIEGDRLGSSELIEIEASPEEGFHWDFFVYLPEGINLDEPIFLEVEVTNTFTDDDYSIHREDAKGRASHPILKGPKLSPAFPRFSGHEEIQYLQGDTFKTDQEEFYRVDLQLIEMIDYAQEYLQEEYGLEIFSEIIIYGASSSAMWAHNFSMIHPERVQAIAAGANLMYMMPLEEWQGDKLKYRYGISDFQEVTGDPFDLESYQDIAKYFYVGEYEPVTGVEYFIEDPADTAEDLIGRYEEIYEDLNIKSQFVIYQATAHEAPARAEVSRDVQEFLSENTGADFVEITPHEFAEDDYVLDFETYDEINIVDIYWVFDPEIPADFQAGLQVETGTEEDIILVTEEGFSYDIQLQDFIMRNGFSLILEEIDGEDEVRLKENDPSRWFYHVLEELPDYDEFQGIQASLSRAELEKIDFEKDYRLRVDEESADSINLVTDDEIILESIE